VLAKMRRKIRKVKPIPLTEREMTRIYKVPISGTFRGLAGRRGMITVAAGGILVGDDGRVWGFIDLHPCARTPLLFRYVMRFLEECKEDGVKEIYVTRDASFETSEEFLTRIGFSKTTETFEDKEVWIWRA
jgi:hypothetical protein